MKKRFSAFLLAALMVAALLPVMSFATEVSTADAFKTAIAAGENVKLTASFALAETVTVAKGAAVELDLNGYTITGSESATGNFELIANKGTLTITDTSADKNGKITLVAANDRNWNNYSAVVANLGGTDMAYGIDSNTTLGATSLTINGGKVASVYRSIRMFANSTTHNNELNINGGELEGTVWLQSTNAKANKAELNITGGEFTSESRAVYIWAPENGASSDLNVAISGGTFDGDVVVGLSGTTAPLAPFVTGGTFLTAEAGEMDGMIASGSENNVQIGPPPVYAGPVMNWVKVNAADNGVVKSGPLAASAGATVTLYPKAAEGYVLDTVEVLDAEGNAVELDGLKFAIPAGGVTVNATFKLAE